MRISNFIKTFFRNIILHRGFSLVTLLGLSIGIAMGLFVLIYVFYESGYDRHFPASERIFRFYSHGVIGEDSIQSALTPIPLINLVNNEDEVEFASRLLPGSAKMVATEYGKSFENRFYYADSSFFRVFEFVFIKGRAGEALRDSNAVVLTLSTSRRLFGNRNPLGETVTFENGLQFKVSAIVEDVPPNTHFSFDFIGNWAHVEQNMHRENSEEDELMTKNWLYLNSYTYVRLTEDADKEVLCANIQNETTERINSQIFTMFGDDNPYPGNIRLTFDLQPIHDIHLYSRLGNELQKGANPLYVLIFTGIAFFILLITAINFMNLTTAKASNRFKEIAVRKVFSAHRGDLVFQFLTEAIVYSFLALFVALVLVELFLPSFNRLFDIRMSSRSFFHSLDMVWIAFITLMVGVISGSYPAFFFSGLKGAEVMEGNIRVGKSGLITRGILVSVQVAVALFLLTFTMGLHGQLKFIKSSSHGFSADNVLIIDHGTSTVGDLNKLLPELKKTNGVEMIGMARSVPGDDFSVFSFKGTKDSSQVLLLGVNYVDAGFFPVMRTELQKGRLFEAADTSDMSRVIINETAARVLGYEEVANATIELIGGRSTAEIYRFNIIGVVEDIYFESRKNPVRPMIFIQQSASQRSGSILIRIEDAFPFEKLEQLKDEWQIYLTNQPLNLYPLSANLEAFYAEEYRFVRIAAVFSMLAFILAILGQIGMAAFVVNYHKRNIEIKKTLAAPYANIILNSFWGFISFILVGFLIAIPTAYAALRLYLSGFTISTDISFFWMFIPFMMISVGVALIIYIVGRRELKVIK